MSEPTGKSPSQERFESFLSLTTPQARAQLQGTAKPVVVEEDRYEFRTFRDTLEPVARDAISTAEKKLDFPEGRKPRYCAIIQEEGEWPVLKIFADAIGMAKALSEYADNKDISVSLFYGIPLPYSKKTKNRPRLIVLPDSRAIEIKENPEIIESVDSEIAIQDDMYMGPEALLISHITSDTKKGGKNGNIPSDPDEDEEAGEEFDDI